MARALALAERGRGTTSPNPMVGAVIVDDEGVVVGRGSHAMAGGPHAEIAAFADAGDRSRGATLYCTLEPCSHVGRTGPCAPRVVEAGIRRAVIAMEDPNPLVSGRGLALLREHGIEVKVGVLEDEARRLNAPFISRMVRRRPWVTLKVAVSDDGKIAGAGGAPIRLTGLVADRRVHRDRAAVDALAVGSGTILADDPLLTARIVYRSRPLVRVVFDRRLRTPAGARLFSTTASGPVIIVTDRASPAERETTLAAAGADIARIDAGGADAAAGSRLLLAALERIAARGVGSMIVEGGVDLHRAFWDAKLVDSVQIYRSPQRLGANGASWFAPVESVVERLDRPVEQRLPRPGASGHDRLIEGDVHWTD
jgi:diaminohydroxyphosphoribosylaminopyrimidine deaminase/5-amino-6-(5-phosphoribosylamino)uracil reductase